jgi:hypothetical protein
MVSERKVCASEEATTKESKQFHIPGEGAGGGGERI